MPTVPCCTNNVPSPIFLDLSGHLAGCFSGASQLAVGLFAQADNSWTDAPGTNTLSPFRLWCSGLWSFSFRCPSGSSSGQTQTTAGLSGSCNPLLLTTTLTGQSGVCCSYAKSTILAKIYQSG